MNIVKCAVFWLLCLVGNLQSSHSVKGELKELADIRTRLQRLPPGSVIFIDVDDTVITPKSLLFHYESPHRTLIDKMKANRDQYPNFEVIISRWRLGRKSMLVHPEWPALLKELQSQHYVYALTQLQTGKVGEIPLMEEWRYNELSRMDLTFTPEFEGMSEKLILERTPYPATFYRGIFITGSATKNEVMRALFKAYKPPHAVIIDDRLQSVEDGEAACEVFDIPFLGIYYRGIELIPGIPDEKVAAYQIQQLIEKGRWVEDEDEDVDSRSLP